MEDCKKNVINSQTEVDSVQRKSKHISVHKWIPKSFTYVIWQLFLVLPFLGNFILVLSKK